MEEVEVWLDAFDLPGGGNVKERIKEGMQSLSECLILLSPASRDSHWVKLRAYHAAPFDEADAAINRLSEQLTTAPPTGAA